MQKQAELIELLQSTFEDQKIDSTERVTLFEAFEPLSDAQRAFVRNRAFDLIKQYSRENPNSEPPYKWLEQIIKRLDSSSPAETLSNVVFSPGEDCLNALLGLIQGAHKSLQICVFTISENKLREALLDAHNRGVEVRIITDNDKTEDKGSDVDWLEHKGVPVRVDRTRHHMHHKFVIADSKQIANGSFNWTKSASLYNHENILLLNDETVIREFSKEFERLWNAFQ
jgi:phosphatidylserine/phosphatidylglycerophosphate/cardiolipin synthase-like enzyme